MVVCTDGGLASYENRKNDDFGERAFITVQSLKKLGKDLQDWALQCTGWKMIVKDKDGKRKFTDNEYNLDELNMEEYGNKLFCREIYIKVGKKGEELEQRLIVTYSLKYENYLQHVRDKQVAIAQGLIDRGAAGKLSSSQNNPKRFIKQEACTNAGELAEIQNFTINQKMVKQEARFDGFYGICTDLKARPVFLQRDDRIKAHFLTCSLALLMYKLLEKKGEQRGTSILSC